MADVYKAATWLTAESFIKHYFVGISRRRETSLGQQSCIQSTSKWLAPPPVSHLAQNNDENNAALKPVAVVP